MKKIIASIITLLGLGAAALIAANSAQSPPISAAIVGLRANDGTAGYARAERVRAFKFPDDHGLHPDFQTEWWYYTGNLDAADGRHFGYQLTFFRRAITPTAPTRASDWATNQIYFAHFALTDVKNNQHAASERFSRGAAGLAGASGNPFRVWVENWFVETAPSTAPLSSTPLRSAQNGSAQDAVQLHAEDTGRALDLTLTPLKPMVLHGDRGLSQKSADVGNASYYYSFTRLETRGTITVNGEQLLVNGNSWMDHEWSTAFLGPNAVGWDWFSIQLSDQRELMLFQIRQKDGSIEPLSSGTLVEPDGSTRHLTLEQFKIDALSTWQSNTSGATYPASWKIAIPSADMQLTLKPYVADQENRVSIVYWEGAVEINGESHGATVRGSGYVEMTGYVVATVVP